MAEKRQSDERQVPEQISIPAAVQIDIIGEIGWEVEAAEVRKQIKAADPKDDIEVELHSPGGSIFEGFLIYNALKEHPGPVSVKILGLSASAASWIPFAADPGAISMHKTGQMMIHLSRSGAFSDADGMERQAKLLRSLDHQMAELYAGRSGIEPAAALDLMRAETWMTTDEAKEAGFIDIIIDGPDPVNRIDLSKHDVPAAVSERYGLRPKSPVHPLVALLSGPDGPQDLKPSDVTPPPPGLLDAVAAVFNDAQGASV